MLHFFDRLVNLVSGLGTSKDKAVGNTYALNLLDRSQLEAAYRSDWLARKIIDIIPFDMTREWRDWQASEPEIEKIEDAERALDLRTKVAAGLQRSRLYGGSILYVGINGDADLASELDIERLGLGCIAYVHVLSRYEVTCGQVDRDVLSPYFGEPEYYQLGGAGASATAQIHPSRVIRFSGAPLPNTDLLGAECWGDSILQVVFDAVQNASSAEQHVASLLPEAKVDIISVPDLSDSLSTDEGTKKVIARFSTAAMIKSLHNTLLIEGNGRDQGEVWQQKQINFTQFPTLLQHFMQVAAGAADIPVTRLLGQSPAGLNSTGESDLTNYYDNVASKQKVELRPTLTRLDEILLRHALGSRPKSVYYEFAPLWQLPEKEKADVALKRAQATQIYINSAVVPAPVMEHAVRNQLIESGDYPGIEQAYAEFDAGLLEPMVDPNTVDPAVDPNSRPK